MTMTFAGQPLPSGSSVDSIKKSTSREMVTPLANKSEKSEIIQL
jgi:hypothetical protein